MITGEVMGEIIDPDFRQISSWVYDMCMDGDALIIPRCDQKTVLYFRLNYE